MVDFLAFIIGSVATPFWLCIRTCQQLIVANALIFRYFTFAKWCYLRRSMLVYLALNLVSLATIANLT